MDASSTNSLPLTAVSPPPIAADAHSEGKEPDMKAILVTIVILGLISGSGGFAQGTDPATPSQPSPAPADLNRLAGEILRQALLDQFFAVEHATPADKLLMLFIVARVRDANGIEKAVSYDKSLQPKDPYALFNQQLYGDEVIAAYLQTGPDPDRPIFGLTPLQIATLKYDARSMDLLLQHGADPYRFIDVREVDKNKQNPLVRNLLNGHYNYLLKMDTGIWDATGNTVPAKKTRGSQYDRDLAYNTPFSLAQSHFGEGLRLIYKYKKQEQALFDACRSAAVDDIRALLDAGVNPNAYDHWRVTPLMTLVRKGAGKTGYKESVELLLDRGAHIYDVTNSLDSALDQAVEYVEYLALPDPVHAEVLDLFIRRVVDQPEALATFFITRSASVKGKVLDQPIPDVNRHPDKLRPALYYAVLQKKPEFVTQLLAMGADPNIRDPQGKPLLSFAKANSTEEIVALLASHGAVE
jgi:ankyrin repeat protein